MKAQMRRSSLCLNPFRATSRARGWSALLLGWGLFPVLLADDLTITTQPTNQNVSLGGSAQFRVAVATTNWPVTFQWRHSDTNLPGATANILRFTNAVAELVGPYQAIVANSLGDSVTSQVAVLEIDPTFIKVGRDQLGDDGFLKTGPDLPGPVVVDFDGDGWLELLLIRGWSGEARYNEIYENNRDGTFTRITNGLAKVAGNWANPAWADLDNDGDLDCLITRIPPLPPILFLNQLRQGSADFTPVTLSWPKGAMPSCADYDGDGWTDVAVTHWRDQGGSVGTNYLVHNDGGVLQVVTDTPFALKNAAVEWASWVDYDDDGDIDFFAATSPFGVGAQPDILFQNLGGGTMLRVTNHVLIDQPTANIMAGWGDYDNDGDLDVFLPYHENLGSVLYRNLGGGQFEPDPEAPVLEKSKGPLSPSWGDYDNDGDLDLLVTQDSGPCRLFGNDGTGRLTELWVGSPSLQSRTYQGLWLDYDNDGFLDLLAVQFNGDPHALFLNNLRQTGNQNHWLKVQLRGKTSNPDGLGAKVRVGASIGGKTVWQMRTIGVLPTLGTELLAHFGLGDATNIAMLRIEWPSGNVQELTDVAPDQLLTVTEPSFITPVRPSASLNGSVKLRSTLAGTRQWRFDGVDLVGQTNPTLVLTNLTAQQEGRYSVVLDTGATLVTNHSYLVIDTQFTKITEGPLVTDRGCTAYGSWGDCDGDGDWDLFLARHDGGRSAFYRNDGDGTFTSITNLLNAPFATVDAWVTGAWADLDNDGLPDLVATRENKPAVVYFSNGDGTFSSQLLAELQPNTVAVVDYDRDGRLDLLLYGSWTWTARGPSWLYRNNGDRTFTHVTRREAGSLLDFAAAGSATCADYDDDGWVDVFCSTWTGTSELFRNDGTGRFAWATNVVFDQPAIVAGAWGDYDNDGRLDLCTASYGGISFIYRNLGSGEFEHASIGQSLRGSYFSATWGDYDNDGFLDLLLTSVDGASNAFLHNNGDGTFARNTIGSIPMDRPTSGGSWAAFWFDPDHDGFLDLYVINNNIDGNATTANFLYHNNGNSNAWLKIKLIGTTSNRDAVGAKVRVHARYAAKTRWQRRDITGGDVMNGNQPYAHFGLGSATNVATLRVEWPSGTVQELTNVAVNQILTIVEPRRPVLTGGVRAADGAFVLSVAADAGQQVRIYASSDLTGWVEVGQWTGNGQTLELPPLSGARFFKAEVVE